MSYRVLTIAMHQRIGYTGFYLVGALEPHCLRADRIYSKRAYQDSIDYRFAEE